MKIHFSNFRRAKPRISHSSTYKQSQLDDCNIKRFALLKSIPYCHDTISSINFISIGSDCSPAAAQRSLQLRNTALPFDWIVSNINAVEKCFNTDFKDFHKNLRLNSSKSRLIDSYGFLFPHDYPRTKTVEFNETCIGDGVYKEEAGTYIVPNWIIHHDTVLKKYERRIERFRNVIRDSKPLIILCRYNSSSDIIKIQNLLLKNYGVKKAYCVNSSSECFENDTIINIYTEKNNKWNDSSVWLDGINRIILKI